MSYLIQLQCFMTSNRQHCVHNMALRSAEFLGIDEARVDGSNLDHTVTSPLVKKSVSQDYSHSILLCDAVHWIHMQAKPVGHGEYSSPLLHPIIKLDTQQNLILKEQKVCYTEPGCGISTWDFSFMIEVDFNTLRCHSLPATSAVTTSNVPCLLGGSCLEQEF